MFPTTWILENQPLALDCLRTRLAAWQKYVDSGGGPELGLAMDLRQGRAWMGRAENWQLDYYWFFFPENVLLLVTGDVGNLIKSWPSLECWLAGAGKQKESLCESVQVFPGSQRLVF
jgi:hypothetical protein